MSTSMVSELFRKGNFSGASFDASPVPAPTGSRPPCFPFSRLLLGSFSRQSESFECVFSWSSSRRCSDTNVASGVLLRRGGVRRSTLHVFSTVGWSGCVRFRVLPRCPRRVVPLDPFWGYFEPLVVFGWLVVIVTFSCLPPHVEGLCTISGARGAFEASVPNRSVSGSRVPSDPPFRHPGALRVEGWGEKSTRSSSVHARIPGIFSGGSSMSTCPSASHPVGKGHRFLQRTPPPDGPCCPAFHPSRLCPGFQLGQPSIPLGGSFLSFGTDCGSSE